MKKFYNKEDRDTVVFSQAEFEQLYKDKQSFIDLIRQSPLNEFELDLKRDLSLTREIDL